MMGKKKGKRHKATQIKPKSTTSFGSLSNQITRNTVTPTYTYKGSLNKTDFPEFVDLCKKTQDELILMLPTELYKAGYKEVIVEDGFIYAKGDIPYLLTAHMDTVHKQPVKDFYEYINDKGQHIISSPQGIGGDDRCGIYIILDIIKEFKPSILFCEDEEIGGVGSDKFCMHENYVKELSELRYLIELDRMDNRDAVFYDCENEDFIDFITTNTGYHEEYGTFSDISTLAPACGIAAVNFSCGYYHAHTLKEEVNVEEMMATCEMVKQLLTVECEPFIYIERPRVGLYRGWYEEDYYLRGYNYNTSYYGNTTTTKQTYGTTNLEWDDDDDDDDTHLIYICYQDRDTNNLEKYETVYGRTLADAWFKFFTENPTVCWNDIVDYYLD